MNVKSLLFGHDPRTQGSLPSQTPRRTAKRRASQHKIVRAPGLEQLEDRQLLAGDVVKIDVNTNGLGSFPRDFREVNDKLVFSAIVQNGQQLFTTDGTEAGSVELNVVGIASGLVKVGGTVFFSGRAGGQAELWKTDGTVAGTVLVKEINPLTSEDGTTAFGSDPANLTNVNGTLYFTANDGTHGRELWKTDGTEAGTVLVRDIRPGASAEGVTFTSNPSNLTNVNDTLFFTADDGVNGIELWKSDGTEAGTNLVKDIRPGASEDGTVIYGSNPSSLIALSGTVAFVADDGSGGTALWRSDGTTDGTVRITDFSPDAGPLNPTSLVNVDGTLFFIGFDTVNGAELWRSDGTAAGTTLVRDINPGSAGSSPANMFNFNGTLVFSADDGANGAELWRSDGSEAGTLMIHDINAGATGSFPTSFLGAEGRFYFRADDGPAHGNELWSSDGTTTGTHLAADFRSGPLGSAATPLYEKNGIVYVSADVNTYGVELWKTDGTQAGTQLVKDIRLGNWGSSIHEPIEFQGQLFFSADTCPGCFDFELWKTDGTQSGTSLDSHRRYFT